MVEEQGYLAMMVRLWTVHDHGEYLWRASIEDVHTGERRAFADVEDLFYFLRIAMDLPQASRIGETLLQLEDDTWFDQFWIDPK